MTFVFRGGEAKAWGISPFLELVQRKLENIFSKVMVTNQKCDVQVMRKKAGLYGHRNFITYIINQEERAIDAQDTALEDSIFNWLFGGK